VKKTGRLWRTSGYIEGESAQRNCVNRESRYLLALDGVRSSQKGEGKKGSYRGNQMEQGGGLNTVSVRGVSAEEG